MSRRTRLTAIGACLAGAGLTLYAVTRVWSVTVEYRPGLSDLRTEQTGGQAQPVLIGLALVALAGTGALLSTGGRVRRGLGVLLTLLGAGMVVGAVLTRAGMDVGEAGAGSMIWPAACVLGGAAVAGGGVLAARHGHLWPAMSSRYERSTVPPAPTPAPAGSGPRPASGSASGPACGPESGEAATSSLQPSDNRAFWEALDRGDDPTAR